MTKVMQQDLKTAANSVNVWIGVTTLMPLLGAFLADAYTGRYFMILFSAILYVLVSHAYFSYYDSSHDLISLPRGSFTPKIIVIF